MLRKIGLLALLVGTLTMLSGCIIHEPAYYPTGRVHYDDSYAPYYYTPYLYTPFWFSGLFFFGDYDRGHDHRGHRDFDGRSGRGGRGGGRR